VIEIELKFKHNFGDAIKKMTAALGESTLRAAGSAGAKVFQDEMIRTAPVLAKETKQRKSGVIKRAVIVKRDIEKSNGGDIQTYLITVRGKRKSEADAYFWKWVEDGHRFVRRRKTAAQGALSFLVNKKTGKETMKAARELSEAEYGTAKKGARPFMRPSYEAKKREALEVIKKRMAEKISESLAGRI
jgi:hypothetical protein